MAKCDARLIDDIGDAARSSRGGDGGVLFTLLAEWYERGIAHAHEQLVVLKVETHLQRPDDDCGALSDCSCVHHSATLELNIPSYRMEQAKKNRDAGLESAEAK